MKVSDITPPGLKLRKYQLEDLRSLIKTHRYAMLKYSPGLGKTIITIALINAIGFSKSLIICPASMRMVWKEELDKWLTTPLQVVVVRNGKTPLPVAADIVVVTYEQTLNKVWRDKLVGWMRSAGAGAKILLAADESQNVKNWQAKRTSVVYKYFAPLATHRLLLTATPIMNQVTDLHSQFSIIKPRCLGKFYAFADTYSNRIPDNYAPEGFVYRGVKNVPALRKKLSPYLIVRRKEDVLKDLPPLIQSNVYCDIPPPLAKATLKAEARIITALKNGETDPGAYATGRHELGIAKLPAAKEWLKTFWAEHPHQSLVVFAWHQDVLAALQDFCTQQKKTAGLITGSVSQTKRDYYRHEFQAGRLQVLCNNIQAGGVGITLTHASTCFFAELDFTPNNLFQAYNRLHRIGQLDTVNVVYLVADMSIEAKTIGLITSKLEIEAKVLERRQ